MPEAHTLIDEYARGSSELRAALQTVSEHELDLRPIAGKWSIREVVCHLADSEIVYADRIKRVLAEDNPTFFEADPDQFRQALWVENRNVENEFNVVTRIREHMEPILRSVRREDFDRMGQHSLDGPMTLMTLLSRITGHIPHHVRFVEEKVAAMRR
ncbi:MAG: DinB family protein [Planctomycetota bacterium]